MKFKIGLMLTVFLMGIIPLPVQQVQAVESQSKSLENAISLMYISDALLLDVNFLQNNLKNPTIQRIQETQ